MKHRHLAFDWSFNQPLDLWSIPSSVSHLTFSENFNRPLLQNSVPVNLIQLNFWGSKNVEIDNEILDRINLEINYHIENFYYNKSRIINLFIYGHNNKIPRTNINMDEYVIEDEWNDYIGNNPVTKIKLIPKIIMQSRVKSAKKLTY